MIYHQPIKALPGYSVAEVLLAVFILSVGIISVASLVSTSYVNSSETQKLIIASELAQEGVELVRNLRDNEIADKAETGSPSDVLNNLAIKPNKDLCSIDYNDNDITCDGGRSIALRLNAGGKDYYEHDGAQAIQFYRRIKLVSEDTGARVRVFSFVAWDSVTAANLNGTVDTTISNCTTANHCVYTELLLTPWK